MSDRQIVGFDRRVDLGWLDAVACRVADGENPEGIRDFAHKLLGGNPDGSNPSSANRKTVAVLSHIWSSVPEPCIALRDGAAKLFLDAAPAQRIAIHWAMMTATYSFFRAVAEHAGRLLSLQGSFTLVQITRRMSEDWGDRSTLSRAVQRIVRSMVQWGVLLDSGDKGVYKGSGKATPISGECSELLLEAVLLHLDGGSVPVDQATRHPAFFPFKLGLTAHQLRQSARFDVHRQGLDVDVVELLAGS